MPKNIMRILWLVKGLKQINTILAIQMNIFMVLLLSGIAVHAYLKLDRKVDTHRVFFTLITLMVLLLLLEILSVVLNTGNYPHFISVHKLVDTLGFTLAPFVPMSALRYVLIRTNKTKILNKKWFFGLSVPVTVNSFMSFGSIHFNWIFGITGENQYVRGPLFWIAPVTSFFYYIIILLILFEKRGEINKEERFIISLLAIVPIMMAGIQLYYFVYLTIWNSTAIAVILNYILIIHSQTKLDPLTGLGNRLAYDECLSSLRKKSNIVLSVISIDLDDFKNINDRWGHHEGDKVLREFARQLEEVFGEKGVSIRLGGDEFIVLIDENQQEVIEKYLKTLKENINAYNETTDMPYHIGFSYGMTIFNSSYNDIDELIQHSDKLMYKEKQGKTYKSQRKIQLEDEQRF